MVEVFLKTMPKPWNGSESQQNKEILMLNINWAICTIMVSVLPKIILKLRNGIVRQLREEM